MTQLAYEAAAAAWSALPPIGGGADDDWVRSEAAGAHAAAAEHGAEDAAAWTALVEEAARAALELRRPDATLSFFFRPEGLPVFGVVHVVALGDADPADDDDPLSWLLPGVELAASPSVVDFSTPVVERGYRVAYAARETGRGAPALGGIVYGFDLGGLRWLVFSELLPREAVGMMQALCDPIVDSFTLASQMSADVR